MFTVPYYSKSSIHFVRNFIQSEQPTIMKIHYLFIISDPEQIFSV